MAFQQGLSGLSISSKALDVISNNIANASTIGFKGGQAQFADVYAASLGVGGGSQVGIGASMPVVQQQFSQGNISNSTNPLDVAVNGSGFFRLQKSETDQTVTYSRNGQFHLNEQGAIVNAQGNNLTGYGISTNITDRSKMIPVKLDTSGAEPLATGASEVNPGVETQINMDDRDLKSLTSGTPNNLAQWSGNVPPELNSFNYSTSVTIYDQKGNSQALSMYFTRVGNSVDNNGPAGDLWQTHFVLGNADITKYVKSNATQILDPTKVPTLQFDASGAIVKESFGSVAGIPITDNIVADTSAAAGNPLSFSRDPSSATVVTNLTQNRVLDPSEYFFDPVTGAIQYTGLVVAPVTTPVATGNALQIAYQTGNTGMAVDSVFSIDKVALEGANPQFVGFYPNDIPIDFASSTQFGSGYDVNKLVQDGYAYGRLSGVSVSSDGILRGSYSNGQTKDIAQLVLVDFVSPTGLASLGNNQWGETAASGQPLVGDPGTGNRGVLQSAAVEEANVDLTQELVSLITQQRNYQANAQSIKTQDQILQTLVNLR